MGTPTHGLTGRSPKGAQSEVFQHFSPRPSMSTSYALKLHSRNLVPCHFRSLLMLGDRALPGHVPASLCMNGPHLALPFLQPSNSAKLPLVPCFCPSSSRCLTSPFFPLLCLARSYLVFRSLLGPHLGESIHWALPQSAGRGCVCP